MFWPLAAYAGVTLVSAAFSLDPSVSLIDCKQLRRSSLIVPIAYRLLRGRRSLTAVDVIITVGARQRHARHHSVRDPALRQSRPAAAGHARHYMTYSGLLMLVVCAAAARIMFAHARSHLGGAGHAGAAGRARAHLHAATPGSAPACGVGLLFAAARLPAARAAAGRARRCSWRSRRRQLTDAALLRRSDLTRSAPTAIAWR